MEIKSNSRVSKSLSYVSMYVLQYIQCLLICGRGVNAPLNLVSFQPLKHPVGGPDVELQVACNLPDPKRALVEFGNGEILEVRISELIHGMHFLSVPPVVPKLNSRSLS